MNAEETHKQDSSNNEITFREQLQGTPFWIIGNNENKEYFLAMGKHKLSPSMQSDQEIIEWAEKNEWLLILNVCICIYTDIVEAKTKRTNQSL